jgi:Zn-dependent metalloprotease
MKKRRTLSRLLLFICLCITQIFLNPGLATAHSFMRPRLEEQEVRTDYHDETGKLSFLGTDPNNAIEIQPAMAAGLRPEDRALTVLDVYGPGFGLSDPAQELTLMRARVDDKDRSSVRYQQVFNGVPILAGELIVNQDSQGRLISISGEISPDLSISTESTFSSDNAKNVAVEAIAKYYGLSKSGLKVTDPELWIFDERLLKPSARPPTLVWRMEVGGTQRIDIKELVLIDANFGSVMLHFNQIDAALDRDVYDNENNPAYGLPGNGPVRSEGDPPTGVADVNFAYDYMGDTYDFYFNEHGRDSVDDAGMTLISTVRYCPDAGNCPYANAFWNGSQMVFGDGYASGDDVVAHELTHGVTSYESSLFYFYESGAINETFSDLWGEFVDLTNGAGNDTSGVRWLMGEDLPIGAIRDMSNPPAYGLPDRMGSGYYHCSTSDNGGVHYNMGVGSKAAYLLTDGDSFNGYVVTGLGISKVADLFYEVNTNLLTSGSNYNDLYNALIQAGYNLSFSKAERQEVLDAINATEMDQRPCGDPAEAPICSAGLAPSHLFFDDLENTGSGNWVSAADSGSNEFYYPQNPNPYSFDATNTSSGIYNMWGYNISTTTDFHIAMTSDVTLPANAYLHFKHSWDFEETNYDGGVVEYSTTGGSSWVDAGGLFTHNGYTGTIDTCCGNPLGAQQAFANESRGYTSTRLDLSSLSGQNIRFRFRIGTDESVWDYGWFIDDIRIYTCTSDTTSTVGLYADVGGKFYLRDAHAGGVADEVFRFGPKNAGWKPIAGDWDNNIVETVGLYNSVSGYFYLMNAHAGGGADEVFRFGPESVGWVPIAGDWDGNGTTTVGLYDPVGGNFYLRNAHAGGIADEAFGFGLKNAGWIPIAGDWDGDGTDTIGLYDPVGGNFYLRNAHAGGAADEAFRFGPKNVGWMPIAGDWNADGVDTVGLYEPVNGKFYLRNAHTGGIADEAFRFGPKNAGWSPIAGDWDGL